MTIPPNDYFAENSLNSHAKRGSKAVTTTVWIGISPEKIEAGTRHESSKIEKMKPFALSLPEVLGSKM